MELKSLRILNDLVAERLESVSAQATSYAFYYLNDKKWFTLDGGEVQDRAVRSYLDSVRRTASRFYRPSSVTDVYFWLDRIESVLRVTFRSAIREQSQRTALEAVDRICVDAGNKYRATHDNHTGLKNRAVFDSELVQFISEMIVSAQSAGNDADEVTSIHRSVYLASLDIDHFKSVNDRFGHGYGDLVLAALAWRIEGEALAVQLEYSGRIRVTIYRLGGEEFQVLIVGADSESEALLVCQRILDAVKARALPSDDEFQSLKRRDFADETPLPPENERLVTSSAGLAAVPIGTTNALQAARLVKRQADLALSTAKIGGRDCVRPFSAILGSYGRVSAVDQLNGVVAIDIGKVVGVKKGQEFFVYPPNYGGETDFFYGEGRSRKRLGKYPRFRSARIAAFDVQDDVSFCRVTLLEKGVAAVAEGSYLEAIPLGSISHLIPGLDGVGRFLDRSALAGAMDAYSASRPIAAYSISIENLEEISDREGMDHANSCLVRIGQRAAAAASRSALVGQSSTNSLAVVERVADEKAAAALAKDIAAEVSAALATDGKVGVGWVFKPANRPPKDLPQMPSIDCLLDAALIAASSGSGGGPTKFTGDALGSSLYRARVAGETIRAIADYKLFLSFGVQSAYAENQMGLLYFGTEGKGGRALEHFKRAALSPEASDVVRANYGCYLILVGSYSEGFELIKDLEIPESYVATRMFGALRALGEADFDAFVAQRPSEVEVVMSKPFAWIESAELNELQKALRSRGKR